MTHFLIKTSLMLFIFASAQAQEVPVLSARFTNATTKDVFAFIGGGTSLQTTGDQQFSKLEVIMQRKVKITRLVIESCDQQFQDGVEVYVNFDGKYYFSEGGKKILTFNLENQEIEAVSVNFRRNLSFCLKTISFEAGSQTIKLLPPKIFSLQKVDSRLLDLFDSRLNSSAPLHEANFKFVDPIEIDKVMIWPGDFTDDIQFKKGSRPKKIDFKCDQKLRQTFEVKDEMLPQTFDLQKATKCRSLNFHFGDQDVAISEMRFLNGEQLWIPDLSSAEIAKQKNISEKFSEAGLSQVLERQLKSVEMPRRNVFRFHADGSFFIRGFDELAKENESFYVIGEMKVKSVGDKRIGLTLKGIKRSSTLEMDSLSCGRKCFSPSDFSDDKFFFEQEILVRKGDDRFYRIDTLSPKNLRRIDFTSARFLPDNSL